MNLLKCPRCGEEYSPSYRRCPFCEEGDHPRKIKYNSSKQSGGRRVSDKKQTQSVRGAMAAVLVVVLLLLSWSLFGDKIVAKITPADDGNTPGVQDDVNTPDIAIRTRTIRTRTTATPLTRTPVISRTQMIPQTAATQLPPIPAPRQPRPPRRWMPQP